MSEIRLYPGVTSDSGGNKIIFTVDTSQGETREAYSHRCQEVFKLALNFVVPSRPISEIVDTYTYRKVGEDTYEIVAPSYQPQEQSVSNERFIHFNGFTVMLYDEIRPLFEKRQKAIAERNYELARHCEDLIQTTIAQRAYDLAYHFIESGYQHRGTFRGEIHESVKMLPDMDTWPE